MICENDKLNIPEEYRRMSASELRTVKEKLYEAQKGTTNQSLKKKVVLERKIITFNF